MKKLIQLIKLARIVFICGNGGSAATAEHLSNDLFSCGIQAICLNSNTSTITMIANDFGYDYIFSKQLQLFTRPEDLLIVISGSGNSKNILEALRVKRCPSFAFLGMGGGKAKDICDYSITVESDDYGLIEDEHMMFVHDIKRRLSE